MTWIFYVWSGVGILFCMIFEGRVESALEVVGYCCTMLGSVVFCSILLF